MTDSSSQAFAGCMDVVNSLLTLLHPLPIVALICYGKEDSVLHPSKALVQEKIGRTSIHMTYSDAAASMKTQAGATIPIDWQHGWLDKF